MNYYFRTRKHIVLKHLRLQRFKLYEGSRSSPGGGAVLHDASLILLQVNDSIAGGFRDSFTSGLKPAGIKRWTEHSK